MGWVGVCVAGSGARVRVPDGALRSIHHPDPFIAESRACLCAIAPVLRQRVRAADAIRGPMGLGRVIVRSPGGMVSLSAYVRRLVCAGCALGRMQTEVPCM